MSGVEWTLILRDVGVWLDKGGPILSRASELMEAV